jgi:hypothetical protein
MPDLEQEQFMGAPENMPGGEELRVPPSLEYVGPQDQEEEQRESFQSGEVPENEIPNPEDPFGLNMSMSSEDEEEEEPGDEAGAQNQNQNQILNPEDSHSFPIGEEKESQDSWDISMASDPIQSREW